MQGEEGGKERCGGLIYSMGVGGSLVEDLKKRKELACSCKLKVRKKGENGHATLQYEMRMISEVVEEE